MKVQRPSEILIRNGYVLTMDPNDRSFPRGFVRIREGVIVDVGSGEPESGESRIIDADGGVIMPGMVNGHTHIGMSLFRSLADDTADRLRRILFPLERNAVTEELVYAASMLTMVEMIQGGVTCFADMYYFENRVAEAAEEIGLRCILGETILSHPSPDAPKPYGGIEIAQRFIESYAGHPMITPAVAPHAPYSLDEDHMRTCGEISERSGTPLLTHLSEMPFEMEQFNETTDGTPVAWMNRLGLVNSRLVAAHCIHVDERDIELLAEGDAGVIHNAAANMKSGKMVAPVPDMLNRGLKVGLGTDGPMSGNTMDIINQLGYAAKIHKTIRRDPTVMPARTVVDMATIGGARALHLDHLIGSLEVGKRADVVVVATDSISMFPMHNPWSALVYGASPRDIDTVLVDGRILMEKRVLSHIDLKAVKAEAERQCEQIAGFVGNL